MMNTRVEMNEEMMEQVNGSGILDMDYVEYNAYQNEEHIGCGGHIANHNNPLAECECEKCGEHHYLYSQFFKNAPIF